MAVGDCAKPVLQRLGLSARHDNLAKAGPVLAIIAAIVAVSLLHLQQAGVKVVGPSGPARADATLDFPR
jgi:SulP family sulfate permease